jgi:hypothetical protein
LARARWLEQEAKYLLPVEYHHVVFTLPREIGELGLANPAVVYGLLFEAASFAVRQVAADPKYLGAQVGMLAVLHTWGQNLHHHPHLHCVVTGGGLSCNDKGVVDATPRWRSSPAGYFLPVRVLSVVFRDRFTTLLAAAQARGELDFPDALTSLGDAEGFTAWLTPLCHKDWVVFSKPPFGGADQVLKYLARYTHRVAISNHRLEKLENGRVTFRYKDYAAGGREKRLTLSAEEFLRRFVQHVLPASFVKIRHYGLLANRYREAKLKQSRQLLLVLGLLAQASESPAKPIDEAAKAKCPKCGGTRIVRLHGLSAEELAEAEKRLASLSAKVAMLACDSS